MRKRIVPVGSVFGRLTVIGEAAPFIRGSGRKELASQVRCECGVELPVRNVHLRSGHTQSCGCFYRDSRITTGHKRKTHGHSLPGKMTGEYRSWSAMLTRCTNQGAESYQRYGARGITVCDRWRHSFQNFLADMGKRPSTKHSIDRWPDTNGNYEPLNCRWATPTEQQNNKNNNRRMTFYGKTLTATEWSRISQVSVSVIFMRLRAGWSNQRAVWTQTRKKKLHNT